MSQIKRVITFDAFNTLFTPRESISELYKSLAELHNIKHDTNFMNTTFPKVYKQLNQKHPNYGKFTGITYQNWWFNLVDGLYPTEINNPNYKLFREDLYESFKSDRSYISYKDLNNFLDKISKRDDTVLLCLSNGDPRVLDVLSNLGISQYFKEGGVKLSYDIDLSKSSPKFYEYITQELQNKYPGIEVKNFWHFGDELVNDLTNSYSVGWNSVLVDRTGSYTPDLIIMDETNTENNLDKDVKCRLFHGFHQAGCERETKILPIRERQFLIRDFKNIDELLGIIFE